MPQSLANLIVHLVFSTKNRHGFLATPEIRQEMSSYLAGMLRELKCPAIVVNAVRDHVHLLFRQSKTLTIANIVEGVKTSSSSWAKTKGEQYSDFYWQNGYGAFSVSQSNTEDVQRYILGQEEHHKRVSFQDEFRRLLERHGVEYDERYVWD